MGASEFCCEKIRVKNEDQETEPICAPCGNCPSCCGRCEGGLGWAVCVGSCKKHEAVQKEDTPCGECGGVPCCGHCIYGKCYPWSGVEESHSSTAGHMTTEQKIDTILSHLEDIKEKLGSSSDTYITIDVQQLKLQHLFVTYSNGGPKE